jgi:hypothetical protein
MKNCTVEAIVISMIFLIASCQKPVAKTLPGKKPITGKWELVQAQNGMTPAVNYKPGNGNVLVFSDSTFEQYADNQLIKKGGFIVLPDSTVSKEVGLEIEQGKFPSRIVYDNDNTAPKIFVDITDSSLSFLSGFFPLDSGSKSVYRRMPAGR